MKISIYRFFLAVLISCISLAVYSDPNDNAAALNVRGEAVLMVAPDQVTLSIGVISEAKKADAALSENSEKMRGAIALLESLGFSDEDYQTQRFSIRPKWSNRSDKKREIVGYTVNNTLRLTTTRLDDIGDIIAAVTGAGVNQIQSIQFGLKNPRQYREQAISAASNNAKADATALAKANGLRLRSIRDIHLDNATASISQVPKALVMESRVMADSAPPIDAGDIAVRASVSIVYNIDGTL